MRQQHRVIVGFWNSSALEELWEMYKNVFWRGQLDGDEEENSNENVLVLC